MGQAVIIKRITGTMGGVKMKYTKLGNSGLEVSRICRGCMGFGSFLARQYSWTI